MHHPSRALLLSSSSSSTSRNSHMLNRLRLLKQQRRAPTKLPAAAASHKSHARLRPGPRSSSAGAVRASSLMRAFGSRGPSHPSRPAVTGAGRTKPVIFSRPPTQSTQSTQSTLSAPVGVRRPAAAIAAASWSSAAAAVNHVQRPSRMSAAGATPHPHVHSVHAFAVRSVPSSPVSGRQQQQRHHRHLDRVKATRLASAAGHKSSATAVAQLVGAGRAVVGNNGPARVQDANRLASPVGVQASGPRLELDLDLPWPPEVKAAFAISIRPMRWDGMRARLGPWSRHVKLWPGTNGALLNKPRLITSGWVGVGSPLKRGEIGCAFSHYRLWKHIVEHRLPITWCFEDDANVRYTSDMAARMRQCFDELRQSGADWDMLYMGRGRQSNVRRVTAHLVQPRGCCGLFSYVLTLRGAQKLLAGAVPFDVPVDVYVARMHDGPAPRIKALALEPRLSYVAPVYSDTANMK